MLIVKYEWDFDYDGTFQADATKDAWTWDETNSVWVENTAEPSPETANWTYTEYGIYTAMLRVTDSNDPGKLDTETITVTVSDGNQAPEAVLSVPTMIETGQGITLDGSGSRELEPGDSIVSYDWTVDGKDLFIDEPSVDLTEDDLAGLALTDPTSVIVTLTVTDEWGHQDVATATFGIFDNEPLPEFTATDNPAYCNVDVDFDASGSTHTWPTGTITKFEWDFNYDGTNFDVEAEGETTDTSYSQFGDYDVALRVTDGNGKTAISVLTVDVSLGNNAPTADAGGPYVFASGDAIILDGTGSFDSEVNLGDSIVAYRWDLDDDGQYDDAFGATPTIPAGTLPVDQELDIALQVEDAQGGLFGVDTTTLEIVTNLAPVANAGGPYTLTEGTAFNLDGTGSTDDGSIITYQWDLDYDGTTFHVDVAGAQPSVTFADDIASQTVALRVVDAGGKSNIHTTTLTVQNADPSADIDGLPVGAVEGQTINLTGLVNDLGVEDTHTFDWSVTFGGNEVATGTGEDFNFVPQDNGAYQVTLTVTDDDEGESTVIDTITVLNADPAAGDVTVAPTFTIDGQSLIGDSQAVTVSGSFTDPGALDTHTVSVNWGDGTTTDAAVDQAAGTYQASHTFAAGGHFTVVATVTDDDNDSDQADLTVNVVENLGVVDFKDDLVNQDPSEGDLWYRLTAAHDAFLTIELGGTGASSASVALFDANGTIVDPVNNGPSDGADYLVTDGTSFFMKLSGTAADVDVRLTNLVSVDGAAVNVRGTDQDDAFEFELTNSYFVRINGTQYHFADGPGVAETVTFDGGIGNDLATFIGSAADESAQFYTGTGEFYSGSEFYDTTGFFVDAAAENLVAHSGGGRDFIKMYDSPGDDLFVSNPKLVTLDGPGYSHEGHNFYVGLGYATNREGDDGKGGADQATMADSVGSDKFKLDWASSKNFFGKLYDSSSFYTRAKNFESIDASASDGYDLAVVIGSPVDDEFYLKKGVGRFSTERTEVEYLGFDSVIAYARGGHDSVYFEDSTGDDELRARPDKTIMTGLGYELTARFFEEIYAEAKNGGYDKAKLHDTTANDILHAEERAGEPWAQLAVNGEVEDPLYEVLAFEFIKAYHSDGDDKVDRTEAFDWLLFDGEWTDE